MRVGSGTTRVGSQLIFFPLVLCALTACGQGSNIVRLNACGTDGVQQCTCDDGRSGKRDCDGSGATGPCRCGDLAADTADGVETSAPDPTQSGTSAGDDSSTVANRDQVSSNPADTCTPILTWPDRDGDTYGDDSVEPEEHCEAVDGFVARGGDCHDADSAISPDALEACNGIDDNCNGQIDEGSDTVQVWPDADHDGFGDSTAAQAPVTRCRVETGWVDNAEDCNDDDPDVHPNALETCNTVDDDCDGAVDEDTGVLAMWPDTDGDGFGDRGAIAIPTCEPVAAYAYNNQDCDDNAEAIHPGAPETCNRRDDDCNGVVDDHVVDVQTWFADVDGDSYGDANIITHACEMPAGYVSNDGDCDDRNAAVNPQTAEICDGIDNNCSGAADEGAKNACGLCGAVPAEVCGDGLDNDCNGVLDDALGCACDGRTMQPCYSGPPETRGVGLCIGGLMDCACPNGTQFCVDGSWNACQGEILPAEEVCDGLDNDCDGTVDEGLRNACGHCIGDGPAPVEICDGLDNDCDGAVDEGVTLPCGLCAADVGDEICGDGLDNDCDGAVDEQCQCTDSEEMCYPGPAETLGVGVCRAGTLTCYLTERQACEGFVVPTLEVCDGLDNDCDGHVDLLANGCSVCGNEEICDGVDNDCDGLIDEGLVNACGCIAEVIPEEDRGPAFCNGVDDDCDGMIDEGLVNACGTCGETCYTVLREPTAGDDVDEGALIVDADDPDNPTGRKGVTLQKSVFIPPFIWAANHKNDTLSRFNTDSKQEEGRYWAGDNVSRTAVDLDGNVWAVGRNDGRVTKVLWNTEECPDRNGNDSVDTSRPDNLGPINTAANPLADECVVYSQVLDTNRQSMRGVAAGTDGRIWVGYSSKGGGIQSIDPHTFAVGPYIPSTGAPKFAPDANGVQQPVLDAAGNPVTADTGKVYGLVVDSQGYLYTSSYNRNTLARFDTNTGQWDAMFTGLQCGSYGIAVDAKDRVWIGGWPKNTGVGMFDPATRRFHCFGVPAGQQLRQGATAIATPVPPGGAGSGCRSDRCCDEKGKCYTCCVTGVAAEPATGHIWASFVDAGFTGRLYVDENNLANSQWLFISTIRDADGDRLDGVDSNDLRGIGFDRRGFAWTLGCGSDRVWMLDPATNERAAELPHGRAVGSGTHYTYSDFTGSTALSFTAPRTIWRYALSTGFEAAQLDSVRLEAFVPDETLVAFRVRAHNAAGVPLDWLPAVLPSGAPGLETYPTGAAHHTYELPAGTIVGESFEVEVHLATSSPQARPVLNAVTLGWQRP